MIDRRFFLLLLLIFSTLRFYSQSPNIEWQKSYGGSENEFAFSICKSYENGYLIAGRTESNDGDVLGHHNPISVSLSNDIWIINIDSTGSIIWSKCYGGTSEEWTSSIIQTYDRAYIFAGIASSLDGDLSGLLYDEHDYWVVKIDTLGDIIWQKCLGGFEYDDAVKVLQTSDSGFVIAGYSTSHSGDVICQYLNDNFWLVKLSKNGNIEWSECYGGSGIDNCNTIEQTLDGGFIMGGFTKSNDGMVSGHHNQSDYDIWICKTDSIGGLQWQNCYGGHKTDYLATIFVLNNNKYIICGTSDSNDGDISNPIGYSDYWIMEIDSAGNILRDKNIGGIYIEPLYNASLTNDNGIVLIGLSSGDNGIVSGHHGSWDYWLVKLDSLWNFEWGKCLGGTGEDRGTAVLQNSDGSYLTAGSANSTNGDVTINYGKADYWVVKLSSPVLSSQEIENSMMELSVYQKEGQLNLKFFSRINDKAKIRLFDLSGKIILERIVAVTEGINNHQIYSSGISQGMYFLKIDSDNGSLSEKMVLD